MREDVLEIEVLQDGTIKTLTSAVSAANHQNSEQFLQMMAREAGGQTTREKREDAHRHVHSHGHEHVHGGH